MQDGDRQRFAQALSALGSTFNRQMDEAAFDAWWDVLEDLPIEKVVDALDRLRREATMAPFPAHVRAMCGASEEGAALNSWERVITHIRSGYKTDIDPITERTVQLIGGWSRLGDQNSETLHSFTRKDFLKLYGHAAADERQKQLADQAAQARLEATGGDPSKRVDCVVEMPTLKMFPDAKGLGGG